jgi:hypothetical protein
MESEIHEGFDPGLRCRSANRGNAGILAGRHFDVSRQARRIYQVQSSNSGSCALIGNRKPHREIDMTRPLLSLDLADARRIIAAGERKAIEMGIPYNIAVVDAGGGLVAHVRMDGAWLGSVDIAINKAWTGSVKQDVEVAQAAVAG